MTFFPADDAVVGPPTSYLSGGPAAPTRRRPPRTIWLSFGSMLAAGVVNVIAAVLLVLWVFELKGRATTAAGGVLSEDTTGMSAAQFDGWANDVATSVSVAAAAALVVLAAVYVLMAFLIRQGRNGARITATVFAAFSLLGLFLGPYAWAVVALGLVAVVTMWLPQSSEYITHRAALRRGI